MLTIFEAATRKQVDRLMRDEPLAIPTFGRVLARMTLGEFPPDFMDVVFQKKEGGPDLYDAYAFSQVWGRIMLGEIAVLVFPLGCEPSPDRMTAANNAPLARLDPPFEAWFYGGRGYDRDGRFRWDAPTWFNTTSPDPDGDGGQIIVPPGSVPLEVGTTKSSRTLAHLIEERGIARWPYGSTKLYVLVDLVRRELKTKTKFGVPVSS